MTDALVLRRIGLRPAEPCRFRRSEHGRWTAARISGIVHDGSVVLHDVDGALGSTESVRPERIEVRRPGRRGHLTWRNLAEVAITWEQLELW